MNGFQLERLGMIMKPQAGNPQEIEGVLNPAAARSPNGNLYLFPRLVSRGNYSRIGIARVLFNQVGDPIGVERLGIALEPEADYELHHNGGGGCEDPRITFVEPLRRYIMTYTAFSALGPRIAFAISEDLFHWKRLGLATFAPYGGVDFVHVDNKDASLFPIAIPNHAGKMQMALLHRPLFRGSRPEEIVSLDCPRVVDLNHESIWVSYCPMPNEPDEPANRFADRSGNRARDDLGMQQLGLFNSHYRLATPVNPWERLKIGGGPPPIMTRHGWLIIYHGVSEISQSETGEHKLCYSAGIMVLSRDHPHEILYRSSKPLFRPVSPGETQGIGSDIVFPSGMDRRDDIGLPNRFDIYYGMADRCIGVARLNLPECLPTGGITD